MSGEKLSYIHSMSKDGQITVILSGSRDDYLGHDMNLDRERMAWLKQNGEGVFKRSFMYENTERGDAVVEFVFSDVRTAVKFKLTFS